MGYVLPFRGRPVGARRIKVDRHGNRYWYVKTAEPSEWEYEHRLVAEKKLGRKLLSCEVVHHIDGDTENNDPGNLHVMLREEHSQHHYYMGQGWQPYCD